MNSKIKLILKLLVVFMIMFTLLSCNVVVTMDIFDLAGIIICVGAVILIGFLYLATWIYNKIKRK